VHAHVVNKQGNDTYAEHDSISHKETEFKIYKHVQDHIQDIDRSGINEEIITKSDLVSEDFVILRLYPNIGQSV